jgi:hypothetical protein
MGRGTSPVLYIEIRDRLVDRHGDDDLSARPPGLEISERGSALR